MGTNGSWYGDSPANPGVYTCGCCRGTGVVKVNLQARYCGSRAGFRPLRRPGSQAGCLTNAWYMLGCDL